MNNTNELPTNLIPVIKYAAMDYNFEWFGFADLPTIEEFTWREQYKRYIVSLDMIVIDVEVDGWESSLHKRIDIGLPTERWELV